MWKGFVIATVVGMMLVAAPRRSWAGPFGNCHLKFIEPVETNPAAEPPQQCADPAFAFAKAFNLVLVDELLPDLINSDVLTFKNDPIQGALITMSSGDPVPESALIDAPIFRWIEGGAFLGPNTDRLHDADSPFSQVDDKNTDGFLNFCVRRLGGGESACFVLFSEPSSNETGPGTSSDSLNVVPEPSTWLLLGTSLCGLFGARRRHKTGR